MKQTRFHLQIFFWGFLVHSSVFSQMNIRQTIGACGTSSRNNTLHVQWITGQSAIVKNAILLDQKNISIAQGFLKGEQKPISPKLNAFIYPNPFTQAIHIELLPFKENYYSFSLHDIHGKTIASNVPIQSEDFVYHLGHLRPSTYLITLFDRTGNQKTYHLVRHHE